MKPLLPAAIVLALLAALGLFLLQSRSRPPTPVASGAHDLAAALPSPPHHLDVGARSASTPRDGGPPATGFARGVTVVRGAWGSQPGEFGHRREQESNPEGPMAIAAGAPGEIAIVDQVNRRVQRFRDGKPLPPLPTGGDTIQDLVSGKDGATILLDRLVDKNIQVYDRSGKLINEAPIVGANLPEGGAATGVFADDQGIYVEREHTRLVRIADPRGNIDKERPELPGRPSRDGKLLLAAALVDRLQGQLIVRAFDRVTMQPLWTQPVQLPAQIFHLLLLDSDRQGMIYLAALVGMESPEPPFALRDERIVALRFGPGGAPRGTLELPPLPANADENFRPLSVDDQGVIHALRASEAGVEVVAYSFP